MTEQVENPVEQPTQTPEKEPVEVSSKETKEPTLDITKTEEFRKAQSGWDRQITLSKVEAQKAQAEAEKLKSARERIESDYQRLEAEHERLIEEHDPEALKGYRDTKRQNTRQREQERREAEIVSREFELEQSKEANRLALKAIEIAQEHNVPLVELKACQSEREMELAAKLYKSQKTGPEGETPKVDSAVSSAGGRNLEGMSSDEKILTGVKNMKLK